MERVASTNRALRARFGRSRGRAVLKKVSDITVDRGSRQHPNRREALRTATKRAESSTSPMVELAASHIDRRRRSSSTRASGPPDRTPLFAAVGRKTNCGEARSLSARTHRRDRAFAAVEGPVRKRSRDFFLARFGRCPTRPMRGRSLAGIVTSVSPWPSRDFVFPIARPLATHDSGLSYSWGAVSYRFSALSHCS